MIKDIAKFFGSAVGMIFKFILIIAMTFGGLYCFGTMRLQYQHDLHRT